MRILMIAPQPYYEERGTLIAIELLLKALSERGDYVDLLTIHIGEDRVFCRGKIIRIQPWPRPSTIKPGLSAGKVWCDVVLFFRAFDLVRKNKYDLIHAVEEAGFMALFLGKVFRVPYVFDVDSSMTTQIIDRFKWVAPFAATLRWLESFPSRYAEAVIPMCDSLGEEIRAVSKQKIFVLNDISLPGDPNAIAEDLRELLALEDELLVMYVGNLESYQGIDLLLESFALVIENQLHARLVIIGGRSEDIETYKRQADNLGISEHVNLVGPKSVASLDQYLAQADVLVSPRIQGTNTPMKIYSYLGSGKAVVATNLPTHTQVMDESVAVLAAPDAGKYGAALIKVLSDNQLREHLGRQAAILADQKYSWPVFKKQVELIFDEIEQNIARRPARR